MPDAPTTSSSTSAAARGSSDSATGSSTGRRRARSASDATRPPGARPTCASIATAAGRDRPPAPGPGRSRVDGLTVELRPTDAGQVGLFPEHGGDARRGSGVSAAAATRPQPVRLHRAGDARPGGAGAAVTHVDASRPAVAWARRNAELSGLADRPIRWIVDDARAFVAREARRGRRYDGVVLDPPSYGHGVGGRRVAARGRTCAPCSTRCRRVLEPGAFALLTAHTPGFDGRRGSATLLGDGSRRRRADRRGGRARPRRPPTAAGCDLGAFARVARRRHDDLDALPCHAGSPAGRTRGSRAVAALRDRRERERHGLTLVDGAREIRRALDAGADGRRGLRLRAAAGRADARAALDALEAGRHRGRRRSTRPSSRSSRSATGPRAWSRSSGIPDLRSSGSSCPPIRWSRSSRASRSPATSARSCAPPTAPAPTR